MIVPPFDHEHKAWDRYKAFFNSHGPQQYDGHSFHGVFIQFDTGEVVLRHNRFDPALRRDYKDLGVALYSTADDKCPKLMTPEKQPVLKAWLNFKGSQLLLVDHASQRAVAVKGWFTKRDGVSRVPKRFNGWAYVYFAGDGELPISASCVKTHKPVKHTPEEKAALKELLSACELYSTMEEANKPKTWFGVSKFKKGLGQYTVPASIGKQPVSWTLANWYRPYAGDTTIALPTFHMGDTVWISTDNPDQGFRLPTTVEALRLRFGGLEPLVRLGIARFGLVPSLDTNEYPYLMVS